MCAYGCFGVKNGQNLFEINWNQVKIILFVSDLAVIHKEKFSLFDDFNQKLPEYKNTQIHSYEWDLTHKNKWNYEQSKIYTKIFNKEISNGIQISYLILGHFNYVWLQNKIYEICLY